MNAFDARIQPDFRSGLLSTGIRVLQVNVGLRCNLSCTHCHHACGPDRAEIMTWPVMELVLKAARKLAPEMVDITGGAPELHPRIRDFLAELRRQGQAVQLRTNRPRWPSRIRRICRIS